MSILDILQGMKAKEVAVAEAIVKPRYKVKFRRNVHINMGDIRQEIAKQLVSKGFATAQSLSKALKMGESTAHKKLVVLCKLGELNVRSVGRNKQYFLSETVVPEIEERATERILQYVSDHDGERYTIISMGNVLGLPRGTAYGTVFHLQKRGLLAKDFNLGDKTPKEKIEIHDVTPVEIEREQEKCADLPTMCEPEDWGTPENDTSDTVDGLIWIFIKETRSLNVLDFLKWLNKGESNVR